MPERSADWLAQAERDLEVARHDLEGGYYEWTCFVAQQAAEKAVKGLFQHLHGAARGHSLSKLLERLPRGITVPPGLLAAARRLDRYYIQPRYPNGFDEGAPMDYYDERDAQEAIEDAAAILGFCQRLVSGRP